MSENPNFDLESRAVYKSLNRMTEDFSLIQTAYSYWNKTFSNSPLDPIAFSEALKSFVGVNDNQKRSFMIALYASLSQSIDSLPEVPGVLASNADVATPTASASDQSPRLSPISKSHSPHSVIINQFMKQMAILVKKEGQSSLSEFQQEILAGPGELRNHLFAPVKRWAESEFSSLEIDPEISRPDCSIYSHYFYLILCDVAGPPKADRIMNSIIRKLSDLPEADSFSPKNLL